MLSGDCNIHSQYTISSLWRQFFKCDKRNLINFDMVYCKHYPLCYIIGYLRTGISKEYQHMQQIESLFKNVVELPSVGDVKAKAFKRLECGTILDLLYHMPHDYADISTSTPISHTPNGTTICRPLLVLEHMSPNRGSRAPYKVVCKTTHKNDSGECITICYFNGNRSYLSKTLPAGEERLVTGKIERNSHGEYQISHPDSITYTTYASNIKPVEPVYPLTYGITNRYMNYILSQVKGYICELPEWIEPEIVAKYNFPKWHEALLSIHYPSKIDSSMHARSVARMAYDELLSQQIKLRAMRKKLKEQYR